MQMKFYIIRLYVKYLISDQQIIHMAANFMIIWRIYTLNHFMFQTIYILTFHAIFRFLHLTIHQSLQIDILLIIFSWESSNCNIVSMQVLLISFLSSMFHRTAKLTLNLFSSIPLNEIRKCTIHLPDDH